MTDLLTHYNQLKRNTREVNSDYSAKINQIVTGRKARTYAELNESSSAKATNDSESELKRVEGYLKNNKTVETRLNFYEATLDEVLGVIDVFFPKLVQAKSSTGRVNDLKQQAVDSLQNVQNLLNHRLQGRYMFSGTKTNVLPVVNLSTVSSLVNGKVTANYYQGNSEKITHKINNGVTVSYNITANDSAFTNLIAGLNKAVEAYDMAILDPNSNNRILNEAKIDEANDLVSSARGLAIDLRSKVGGQLQQIEVANKVHNSVKLELSNLLVDSLGVDIPEAMTEAIAIDNTLQATHKTTSKYSQLNFADYI